MIRAERRRVEKKLRTYKALVSSCIVSPLTTKDVREKSRQILGASMPPTAKVRHRKEENIFQRW